MNPILDDLIEQFRAAQDIGVATLTEKLNISRPCSNREWPFLCIEHKIHQLSELNGIGIYAHGYGIKLQIGKLTIDFDWGENGEPDGFDAWRLYVFALDNCPSISVSHELIQNWLADARLMGELTRSGSLYFDPKRRAS